MSDVEVAEHDQADDEQPGRGRTPRFELVSVIMLGCAAVLTAFSAFQASLMGSAMLDAYTRSSQLTTISSDLGGQGDLDQVLSELLFLQWSKALVRGEDDLADHIADTLMTDEQWAAVEWWIDNPDVISPFVDENEDWTNELWEVAEEVSEQADAAFDDAVAANARADTFHLPSVFFAVTLFFAGIANVFRSRRIRIAILVIAGGALAVGAVVVLDVLSMEV